MTELDTTITIHDGLGERYLAAWNAHDGAAVAALVTGTYVDPTLPEPLSGPDIAAMVDGLCACFPDLSFEYVATLVDGDRLVLQWRMRGTNDGAPLPGAPAATGGTINLPGVDVITTEQGRIVDVQGFFDQKTFVEQLGLQALVVPQDTWPVSFGIASRTDLGYTTVPGALTMTWIELKDDAEQAELINRTTEIVTALASEPSFLGMQTTTVGRRNLTLTLWTSPEAAEVAVGRNAPHSQSIGRFEQDGFAARLFTSLWQPHRLNPQVVQCSCGQRPAAQEGAATVTCACGNVLEVQPYI